MTRFDLEVVGVVGDIEVLENEDFMILKVDENIVLSIPRKDHGLDDLIELMAKCVK